VNLAAGLAGAGTGALLIVVSLSQPMGSRHSPRWVRWGTRALFVAAGVALMLAGVNVAGLP
jgi:hypothetical protein